MGLLSYLKGVSSQAVNRSKQMYHSKVMRFGVLATVAAFVFLPVAAPLMALLLLAAPLVYHSAMSLVRPAFSGFSLILPRRRIPRLLLLLRREMFLQRFRRERIPARLWSIC